MTGDTVFLRYPERLAFQPVPKPGLFDTEQENFTDRQGSMREIFEMDKARKRASRWQTMAQEEVIKDNN